MNRYPISIPKAGRQANLLKLGTDVNLERTRAQLLKNDKHTHARGFQAVVIQKHFRRHCAWFVDNMTSTQDRKRVRSSEFSTLLATSPLHLDDHLFVFFVQAKLRRGGAPSRVSQANIRKGLLTVRPLVSGGGLGPLGATFHILSVICTATREGLCPTRSTNFSAGTCFSGTASAGIANRRKVQSDLRICMVLAYRILFFCRDLFVGKVQSMEEGISLNICLRESCHA